VAANGVEALEALERQSYDAVLMDVEMPEMDGLEATRRIHRRWPRELRPHIVAVTANALQGERELCIQAGMDDYLAKPIRIEELSGALGRVTRLPGAPQPVAAVDDGVIHRLASSLGEQGGESVAGLIDAFLDQIPGQVERLRDGLERGDVDEVRREAHTMKANAAAFGAPALAERCRELETAAKDGALERGSELLGRIEEELGRVVRELERVREELRR
jgi:CheY-like chemotaxis protein